MRATTVVCFLRSCACQLEVSIESRVTGSSRALHLENLRSLASDYLLALSIRFQSSIISAYTVLDVVDARMGRVVRVDLAAECSRRGSVSGSMQSMRRVLVDRHFALARWRCGFARCSFCVETGELEYSGFSSILRERSV